MAENEEGFGKRLFKKLVYDADKGDESPGLSGVSPMSVTPKTTARPPAVNLSTVRPLRRTAITPRSASVAPTSAAAATPTEQVDLQYLDQIMAELANAPLPDGFADFVQLFVTLRKKSGAKQTVEESFDIAYTTVNGTKGLTLKQIASVLKTQEELLGGIMKQFESDISADANEKKAGLQQNIGHLNNQIEEANNSLADLERQYQEQKKQLETSRKSAEAQLQQLQTNADSIDATVDVERKAFASAYQAALSGHPASGWIGLQPLQTLVANMKP